MANIFGKELTREELMRRVGDISQVADARESVLSSGRGEGVRAIDIKTGSGLEFTVLPSRGMDIAWASYQGKPISYISKASVVKPDAYEKDGLSFLRSFTCGMVTTCGLTYMGAPCCDEGNELGLHGRISHIPAQDTSVYKEWEENEFVIRVRGKVSESAMFGENMVLTREIETRLGGRSFRVHDTVENLGFDKQPFMILYHVNFGYPVVSGDSRLYQPAQPQVKARDDEARAGLDRYDVFEEPAHGYSEQVFFHDIPRLGQTEAYGCIFNEELRYGAYLKYSLEDFSHFGEWKMMGEGDYVVGLEPGNWYPLGRAKARENGELKYLNPGEKAEFHYEIGIVESEDEINKIL